MASANHPPHKAYAYLFTNDLNGVGDESKILVIAASFVELSHRFKPHHARIVLNSHTTRTIVTSWKFNTVRIKTLVK